MAPVKWNPFLDLITLQERMSQLFDEALSFQKGCSALSTGTWAPPVDIYESDDAVTLTAELPGVDRDDVDVEVNDNILTLNGTRRYEKDLSEEHYLMMERSYGAFQRAFSLPAAVDKDGIKASFKDGVLTVTLIKAGSGKAKHIKVDSD